MKRVGALAVGLMFIVSCASTGQKNTAQSFSANETFPRGYSAGPGPQGDKPVIEAERLVAVSATVIAMDAPKSSIAIEDPMGEVVALKVGDQIGNLDRVQVGDKVVATYYVSLAIRMAKGGEEAYADEKGGSAGEMPAGILAEETTSTSAITAIDMGASTILLQGPYRDVHTMKVRDPGNLVNFKVGDHVTISYIEAVAISVEKP